MNKFPLVDIVGTNKQIGLAIGETMRNQIQKEIAQHKETIKDYQNLIAQIFPYLEVTKKYFPQYLEELKGIADGSQTSFEDMFFINNQEISTDHCTIAVSFTDNGPIIGHNEDMDGNTASMYLLKATNTKGDSFFGLNYATGLPGCAASINSFGLIQCINSLNQDSQIGVPKFFLARAILDAKSLDEAKNIITNTPRASGFNHVLIQGNEVLNIEVAGKEIDTISIQNQAYVHTNHYLSPKLQSFETFRTRSSEERYLTASKLVRNNMTVDNMKNLLSDHSNPEYPIRREDATVGSLVFDPTNHKVHVSVGAPTPDSFCEYFF